MVCNRYMELDDYGDFLMSQSPYGAMWFATEGVLEGRQAFPLPVAIPLRGYVVCNKYKPKHKPKLIASFL